MPGGGDEGKVRSRIGAGLFFLELVCFLSPGFGAAFGALFSAVEAPVVPALEDRDQPEPAVFELFAEGVEADGEGKVHAGYGKASGYDPGALHVEITHEQTGHELAHHAFDGDHMQPAPVPWREGQHGG